MSLSRTHDAVILLVFWNFLLSIALIWVALTSAQHTIDIRTANTIQDISHQSQFESLMEISEVVGDHSLYINDLFDLVNGP